MRESEFIRNERCPWTGKAVDSLATVTVAGVTVGFETIDLGKKFEKAIKTFEEAILSSNSAGRNSNSAIESAENKALAINSKCPWSGKPVRGDSLTRYGLYTVGFCNPGCRNTFNQAMEAVCLGSGVIESQKNKVTQMSSGFPEPIFKSVNSMRGIDHINFGMPAGEAAEQVCRQFYSGVLGFTEVEKPPRLRESYGGLWFDIPNTGMQIHFSVDSKRGNGSKARDFGHLAFHVDDIESIEKALMLHNVKVIVPRQGDVPGVTRRFFFLDPFNNEIEFLHKLPIYNNNRENEIMKRSKL